MPGCTLKLNWNPNQEADIDKYYIYTVSVLGVKALYQTITHPTVQATIPVQFPAGMASGSFSYCISAVDKNGNESPVGPVVTYDWTYDIVPPAPPTGFTVVKV
jgi:hypothetical protein